MYRAPLAKPSGSCFEINVNRTFERLQDVLVVGEKVRIREMSCRCKGMVHFERNTKEQELDHMVRDVNAQNRV